LTPLVSIRAFFTATTHEPHVIPFILISTVASFAKARPVASAKPMIVAQFHSISLFSNLSRRDIQRPQ
jgi:hypothetical protein